MKKIIKNIIYTLSVVLLINTISCFIFFRWDFTANKRYSLGKVSKNIIQKNQEPVTVDFYVTEDLPQNMQKLAKEFHALLKEYKSLSNTYFTINIIHPDTPEKELKATQAGIDVFFQEIREKTWKKYNVYSWEQCFTSGKNRRLFPE